MPLLRAAAILALLLGAATTTASAQELTGTLKKIKDTGTITLGHRESSVPFSYYDDKQQVVGYAMPADKPPAMRATMRTPMLGA